MWSASFGFGVMGFDVPIEAREKKSTRADGENIIFSLFLMLVFEAKLRESQNFDGMGEK